MNTKKKLHPENSSRINTLTRSAWCVAALIFALCTAHAGELSRPGEVIDAGDSYALKDGSRVALQRVLHEVAIKHQSSKSAEPTLRDSGVNQNPLTPLVTVQSGRSNVVDIYYVEDLQAVDKLLNVQGDEISVFSVLMDSASKRRVIATDEIIVQFADGIGRQQAVAQFEPEGLDVLEGPVPSAPRQYLVRIVSG